MLTITWLFENQHFPEWWFPFSWLWLTKIVKNHSPRRQSPLKSKLRRQSSKNPKSLHSLTSSYLMLSSDARHTLRRMPNARSMGTPLYGIISLWFSILLLQSFSSPSVGFSRNIVVYRKYGCQSGLPTREGIQSWDKILVSWKDEPKLSSLENGN